MTYWGEVVGDAVGEGDSAGAGDAAGDSAGAGDAAGDSAGAGDAAGDSAPGVGEVSVVVVPEQAVNTEEEAIAKPANSKATFFIG